MIISLEALAAQEAQKQQEAPAEQPAQEVKKTAVNLYAAEREAEQFSFLKAQLQEAIEANAAPLDILQQVTAAAFGTDSSQAAAVAEMIKREEEKRGFAFPLAQIEAEVAAMQKQYKLQYAALEKTYSGLQELQRQQQKMRQVVREGDEEEALTAEVLALFKISKFETPEVIIAECRKLRELTPGKPAAARVLEAFIIEYENANRKEALTLTQISDLHGLLHGIYG